MKYLESIYFSKNEQNKGVCFFVHGLGDDYKSMLSLANHMNTHGYSILYYDLLGHGRNNQFEATFDNNLEFLKEIILKYKGDNNYFFAHSMGGLMLLLLMSKFKLYDISMKILTIEPSISLADYEFFKWVSEPPIGVGYNGLIEALKNDKNSYIKEHYLINLGRSNLFSFKAHIKNIAKNFSKYQQIIFESKIPFIYIYGKDSTNIEEREKLKNFEHINVVGFSDAMHWVHIDAEDQFFNFIESDFL